MAFFNFLFFQKEAIGFKVFALFNKRDFKQYRFERLSIAQ